MIRIRDVSVAGKMILGVKVSLAYIPGQKYEFVTGTTFQDL